ncbi:hypothetical protein EV384_4855 [Micromonospora kangleipakensis]|uniref:Glyoxalase-like domain-containing protein n=1 Tax=Micromonospora kangleipakensis TaxID=1077942 RepID=A0A4Q8BE71_9ACTN|nr:hypothetical protein [Micromonospora kangleipakensis]RZU76222.1 hypothetical protein EV384_4855 [Micromonospora kangleipakensis]
MHRSRVHALLSDVPQDSAAQATGFWSAALGVPPRHDTDEPEFTNLPDVVPDLITAIVRRATPRPPGRRPGRPQCPVTRCTAG